ncbi:MAG: hypothetical protein ABI599_16565 [Flavobacteriales bacterium]
MPALPTLAVVKKDPLLRFLFVGLVLFVAWLLLYYLVVHPAVWVDRAVIGNLISVSGLLLKVLGFELLPEPDPEHYRTIGVQGGHPLWIGDPCNGVMVMAVFAVFIVAYPGSWKQRSWFLLAGLLSIHLINAVRVATLSIIVTYNYEWLTFNHDYVFYLVVYGWVFLLWWLWVKRFNGRASPAA